MKENSHLKFYRTELYKTSYFKAKSDFVEEPIPDSTWQKVRRMSLDRKTRDMILDPFGGRMDEIPDSVLPFPHRKGNLFNIQYLVKWLVDVDAESEKHVKTGSGSFTG
ncbi:FAD-binding Berberine family protein [Forsythia ovata]|uniref:FAD-binding Berberine family protein n=1 Tax=Forsythia ovata TaxID=205694 RepID=A0ABD1S381_9LAMI